MELFGAGPKPVLVLGGVHGDEPLGADMARRLAALLKKDPAAVGGRPVAILPAANPDGLAVGRRTNSSGIDLNRNLPAKNWKLSAQGKRDYSGPQPASEPETQAIMRAVETLRPGLVISIHATAGGKPCNNYNGPARAVALIMQARNGYPAKADVGYPTPGSLGNWAGEDQNIPLITLELPARITAPECWEKNREALLAAIRGEAAATAVPAASASRQAAPAK